MKQIYTKDDTFLARWLNKELTDAELSDFKKSEDYALFQEIANNSTHFKIPTFNQEKVFANIKAEISKPKTRKLIPTWAYATAAAVLLLLGLTFFLNQTTNFSSFKGQQLAYILPDGSEVKLNGNSEVSFSEKNWKKGNRTLKLKGEGYFKVKKGSKFSVVTKQGVISVLGTQFNVQIIDNYLAVECYEGKVQVKNDKNKTILTPGKGVKLINQAKETYNINLLEPNWLAKNYQYNGVPLSVIFKDLENVYKITVKTEGVKLSQKYSGNLVKDNLEKALKIICIPMNVKFEIKEDLVIIKN